MSECNKLVEKLFNVENEDEVRNILLELGLLVEITSPKHFCFDPIGALLETRSKGDVPYELEEVKAGLILNKDKLTALSPKVAPLILETYFELDVPIPASTLSYWMKPDHRISATASVTYARGQKSFTLDEKAQIVSDVELCLDKVLEDYDSSSPTDITLINESIISIIYMGDKSNITGLKESLLKVKDDFSRGKVFQWLSWKAFEQGTDFLDDHSSWYDVACSALQDCVKTPLSSREGAFLVRSSLQLMNLTDPERMKAFLREEVKKPYVEESSYISRQYNHFLRVE